MSTESSETRTHSPSPVPVLASADRSGNAVHREPYPAWMIADLARSGISAEEAERWGIEHLEPSQIKERTGVDTKGMGGYLIPYPGCNGWGRVRLREEIHLGRSTCRYLQPKKSRARAFIPNAVREDLRLNPKAPVFITEGEKKSISAVQKGFLCLVIRATAAATPMPIRAEGDDNAETPGL